MASTTAPARWQRVQSVSGPNPTSTPAGSSPLYEQLLREWAAAGRTLPGRPDVEWARLSHYPPQPAGESELRPGPPPPRRGWLHDRHPA
ncbi:hypothetical protein [Streptomyces sp. NBC_00829]|uniref:hypothetical protein n=1 Tax=Streptomyces sp. NBC_00829 TaxID=2903679 RepID=UPI00386A7360|nr:hypothetical protein OG293_12235 [Streptomyces sp. NBC_00829]